jgi:hypothetical protein
MPANEIQQRIWDELSAAIDNAPKDGLSASGEISETVLIEQKKFIDGIRFARLRLYNSFKNETLI